MTEAEHVPGCRAVHYPGTPCMGLLPGGGSPPVLGTTWHAGLQAASEASHVIDARGLVWAVVRDGGMATRADYTGLTTIGIAALEAEAGPLVPFDPVACRRLAVEAHCTCTPESADFYCPVHRGRPNADAVGPLVAAWASAAPEPMPSEFAGLRDESAGAPSWDVRAAYMRACLGLAAWCYREADRAQLGEPTDQRGEVWRRFELARRDYGAPPMELGA